MRKAKMIRELYINLLVQDPAPRALLRSINILSSQSSLREHLPSLRPKPYQVSDHYVWLRTFPTL